MRLAFKIIIALALMIIGFGGVEIKD